MKRSLHLACLAVAVMLATTGAAPQESAKPADIVDAASLVPGLVLDIRYATRHNFLGRPVRGYEASRCLLTRKAALALSRVEATLRGRGYGLKVYDCYRPQRAVDDFVTWAKDLADQKMKAELYPSVDKANLFRDGYIAEKSSHTRGSTVDVTIIPLPVPPQPAFDLSAPLQSCERPGGERFADNGIDMGTGFDCFSPLSHTLNPAIGDAQRANRMLLKTAMEAQGFVNLPQEWWHYTLKDEPYPDSYFDFPVK